VPRATVSFVGGARSSGFSSACSNERLGSTAELYPVWPDIRPARARTTAAAAAATTAAIAASLSDVSCV
jgi:hypothetical protein